MDKKIVGAAAPDPEEDKHQKRRTHRVRLNERFFEGVRQNVSGLEHIFTEVEQDNMLSDFHGREVSNRITRAPAPRWVIDVDQPNMTAEEFDAYLDLGESTSRDQPGRVGCKGQGERLAILSRCNRLTLISVQQNGGSRYALQATINAEEWFRAMRPDVPPLDIPIDTVDVPADFPYTSGRRVILEDFTIEIPPDEELEAAILELRAVFVGKIILNGRRLSKPRPKGDVITYKHDDFHGLGQVEVDICIPELSQDADDLYIGISSPVVTLSEFLRNFKRANPELAERIPPVLWDRRPDGLIAVMALRAFKTQAQTQFDERLYRSELCRKIVEILLIGDVAYRLEHALTAREEKIVSTDVKDAVRQVVAEMNAAQGAGLARSGGAGPDAPRDPFIRPFRRHVEFGDTVEFTVLNVEPDDTVEWDPTGAGGTLDTTTGHTVRYTAGMVRSPDEGYRLLARVTRVKDGSRAEASAKIYLHAPSRHVGVKQFQIKPSRMELYPGESREVRVINTATTSGKFVWRTDDPDLLDIEVDSGNSGIAEITAGHPEQLPRIVKLRALDQDDARIEAVLEVKIVSEHVVQPPLPPGGGDGGGVLGGDKQHKSPLGEKLNIDGAWWNVRFQLIDGVSPVKVHAEGELYIDSTHVIFTHATRGDALIQAVREWIAFAIGVWKSAHEGALVADPERAFALAAQLRQRCLKGAEGKA
ncbi:hypothetical protein HY478_00835 [Candidatus Uhrbacteria bacterium]|nr:hypothetical protein [Candidatus Uhrbacteria bacterium]